MAANHQYPEDIDIAQNSHKDVLIAIDLKQTSKFKKPALLYRMHENVLQCVVRDAADKMIPNIVFPKLTNPKMLDFLDSVPEYVKKKGEDADGRVEGHRYVLISEVVGTTPQNVYYALLKKF